MNKKIGCLCLSLAYGSLFIQNVTAAGSAEWDSGQNFHEEVTKVFDFYPHKMTNEEQQSVFPKLDNFFNTVIKNKEKYIEPLREELRRNDNNPYFYFDGGLLLLEISKKKEDIQLIADALVKSDLRDVGCEGYLQHLLNLSLKGANVIEAALRILDDETFTVFIPQHSLNLKCGEGLMFILPRYMPDLYIDKLIVKFNSITSLDVKKSCLNLFVLSNCCTADIFLKSLTDDSQPEFIRTFATESLKIDGSRKNDEKQYTKLFEDRKKVLTRISDEVLYELFPISMKMKEVYICD